MVRNQRTFYVSKNGSHAGPYTREELLQRLLKQDHLWTDYIYDELKKEWVVVMQHPLFLDDFNKNVRGQIAVKDSNTSGAYDQVHEKAWFVLKEGNNYGPFSQLEVIQMLQEKNLFEYDFVWQQKMSSWMRVAEVSEFSADKMKEILNTQTQEVSDVFFRRRHLRAYYGCTLIVHNNKAVFRGRSLEISAGGAGLMIDNSSLQPGQTVFLHFQPGDGVPPFNAVCQVVSKQYVKEATYGGSGVRYGVRFTSISQVVRDQIKSFTIQNPKVA